MKSFNLDSLTKMNSQERGKIIRKFTKLTEDDQIKICKDILNIHYQIKNNFTNSSSLFMAIVLGIKNNLEEPKINRTDLETTRKKIKKQEKRKVEIIKSRHEKKRKIYQKLKSKRYALLIEHKRTVEKMSWREVQDYLATFHKFKVHYTTIYKAFKDIENG